MLVENQAKTLLFTAKVQVANPAEIKPHFREAHVFMNNGSKKLFVTEALTMKL